MRRLQPPFAGLPMIVTFGPSINIINGDLPTERGVFRSFLAGLHDVHVFTDYEGEQMGFQVNFTLLGAYRFLNITMSDIANRCLDLGDLSAGIVELQHDALAWAGADRLGEVGEHELEVGLADVVGDVPHRMAGRRLDEARHIEPFEAMMADRHGPLADGSPHAARDRLQADAMLVRRPDLDLGVRMLAALGGGGALELFLSRARSCSVAASGCCGRGCWIE